MAWLVRHRAAHVSHLCLIAHVSHTRHTHVTNHTHSGYVKMKVYNPKMGMDALQVGA